MKNLLRRFRKDDKGGEIVEYAVTISLLAFGAIAAILLIGPKINNVWTTINGLLTGAPFQ